jgi:hypothetical protein
MTLFSEPTVFSKQNRLTSHRLVEEQRNKTESQKLMFFLAGLLCNKAFLIERKKEVLMELIA